MPGAPGAAGGRPAMLRGALAKGQGLRGPLRDPYSIVWYSIQYSIV